MEAKSYASIIVAKYVFALNILFNIYKKLICRLFKKIVDSSST